MGLVKKNLSDVLDTKNGNFGKSSKSVFSKAVTPGFSKKIQKFF